MCRIKLGDRCIGAELAGLRFLNPIDADGVLRSGAEEDGFGDLVILERYFCSEYRSGTQMALLGEGLSGG